jgi:pimeloyl-ACP methyl ester carboxylesterase
MTSDTFRHDALDLAFVDINRGGRPVVFQHGLCGDRAQIAEVFPDGPKYRRLTLECRGHGESQPGDPAGFSIATFADDVAAFTADRGITRAAVGGVSMGAAIALRLAVTRPDLVSALVLVRPAWTTDAGPRYMRPNLLVGELLARLPPTATRASFEASETARRLAAEAPDNLTSLRGMFVRQPIAITAALLRAISLDGPGVSPADLGALRIPTLIVATDRDHIHPMASATSLAGLIPGARMVEVIPKAIDRAAYAEGVRTAVDAFLLEIH